MPYGTYEVHCVGGAVGGLSLCCYEHRVHTGNSAHASCTGILQWEVANGKRTENIAVTCLRVVSEAERMCICGGTYCGCKPARLKRLY